tara:strand:+ start:254 stop:1006 length:753 start_codon:yes stop_codon:yes gene_type:complete
MKNNFLNSSKVDIRAKPSTKSEILSQILYGEKFKILERRKNWYKVKTDFDDYVGFIKKNKFYENFNPTLKIFKSKSKIFKKRNNKFCLTNKFLYFASGIEVLKKEKNYIEFEKNKWIKKTDTKKYVHTNKNFTKIMKLFLNSKYLWGGKTSDGIDCSGLIQIFFYYNRIFFPRDTKDQIKFCKEERNGNLKKGDMIFWKGHVGINLSKSKFIHAYGPKKKVLIMPTNFAINLIKKTTNLRVKKVSNIKNY